jgi:CRISPR-associated protein Cas1
MTYLPIAATGCRRRFSDCWGRNPMAPLTNLPRFRDAWSYLYLEKGKIDQDHQSIAFHTADGTIPIPVASLAVLMLGPGTSITHAAVRVLAESNCLVIWCGDESVRFYATGSGGSGHSQNLIQQAALASDPHTRLAVSKRMYAKRFSEPIDPNVTIEQLRGMEGYRVRQAYAQASQRHGITWTGRSYDPGQWSAADPANRALSAANACLYGLVQAAIVSAGYSPALGFIHVGKPLSFVYDIADLYKTELTIPLAFAQAAESTTDLERSVRIACLDLFYTSKLMQRIIPDIEEVLNGRPDPGTGTDIASRPPEPDDDRGEGGSLRGLPDLQSP